MRSRLASSLPRRWAPPPPPARPWDVDVSGTAAVGERERQESQCQCVSASARVVTSVAVFVVRGAHLLASASAEPTFRQENSAAFVSGCEQRLVAGSRRKQLVVISGSGTTCSSECEPILIPQVGRLPHPPAGRSIISPMHYSICIH